VLLGSVTFVMSLFHLVNHSDEDIRRHSWSVISKTVSIFVAVLLFQALTGVLDIVIEECLQRAMVSTPLRQFIKVATAYLGFVTFFCCAHWALASYAYQRRRGLDIDNPGSRVERHAYELEFAVNRKLSMLACGNLLGRVCGVSLIRCAALVQHLETFRTSPMLAMMPVVFNALLLFAVFRLSDMFRSRRHFLQVREAYDRWNQFAEEVENDIAMICLSFSVVVVARYALCGQLSNLAGVEEPIAEHTALQVLILLAVGFVFAFLAVFIIIQRKHWCLADGSPTTRAGATSHKVEESGALFAAFSGLDPWPIYISRWVFIWSGVSAIIFSWSIMFSVKWSLHRALVGAGYPSESNCCVQRMFAALVVSFGAFLVIRFLDMLADLDATGEDVDCAILCIIKALAILVGFSWEQSFDAGTQVVSELVAGPAYYQACFKLLLAVFVAVIMIPAWRNHLLKKTLENHSCVCGAILMPEAAFCHRCGRKRITEKKGAAELEDDERETTEGLLSKTVSGQDASYAKIAVFE